MEGCDSWHKNFGSIMYTKHTSEFENSPYKPSTLLEVKHTDKFQKSPPLHMYY